MAKLTFHRATGADIGFIADNIWHEDETEVLAAGNRSVMDAIQQAAQHSKACVVAKIGDMPLVIYGLHKRSVLSTTGVPWMLTTKQSKQYRREFMVYTRQVIDEMLTECELLVNYVHSENKTSIKWLQALGFTIDEPMPNNKTGELFHRFHKTRNA